jgi:hypothetical protein
MKTPLFLDAARWGRVTPERDEKQENEDHVRPSEPVGAIRLEGRLIPECSLSGCRRADGALGSAKRRKINVIPPKFRGSTSSNTAYS